MSRNRKDNPYSVEDEELRKFVSGRIKYWKAKEREEVQWAKWQKKFQRNVEKIKEIEKDPDISRSAKREKWQELLRAYSKDNPYSEEDEKLRTYAKERIEYLEREKVIGFDTPNDKLQGFDGRNPFGEAINNKAKRIYKNSKGFWEADYGDGIVMVYIPPGEFKMGSNDGYYYEKTPHTVYLDGYWMGKYEVTFAQYDKYCDDTRKRKPDDKGWGRGKRPVIKVSWNDASAYCDWLSEKTGLKFKLPTEAQWEKAARGTDSREYPWGSHSPYYNGKYYANFDPGKDEADGFRYTSPVGSYPRGASPYGLLDMAGNVWEWCGDWYDSDYYKNSPKNNPIGPKSGSHRVKRGGSWLYNAAGIRCADRNFYDPSDRNFELGFRLSQDNR